MTREDEELVAARRVRDARGAVSAGRHDMLSVGAERDVRQSVRVAREARGQAPVTRLPDARGAVGARARDPLPVGAERDGDGVPRLFGQGVDTPPALTRPHPHAVVGASGQHASVVRGDRGRAHPGMAIGVQGATAAPARRAALDRARRRRRPTRPARSRPRARRSRPGWRRRSRLGGRCRTRPSRPVTSTDPSEAKDASVAATPVGIVSTTSPSRGGHDDRTVLGHCKDGVSARHGVEQRSADVDDASHSRREQRALERSLDALARDSSRRLQREHEAQLGIAIQLRVCAHDEPVRLRHPCLLTRLRALRERIERHAAHRDEQHRERLRRAPSRRR